MSLRKQPSYNVDRKRWNQAWERDLKNTFLPRGNYRDMILGAIPASMQALMSSGPVMTSLQSSVKELLTLQRDITSYLDDHPDFNNGWLRCTRDRREELLLEGLVRSCDAVADMEDRRVDCPESTLEFLEKGKGHGFLNLVALVRDPPDAEPRTIPHPVYDALIGVGNQAKRNSAEKLLARQKTIIRNFFLSMLVWNTCLAFYGERENFKAVKTTSRKEKGEAAEARKGLKKSFPDTFEEAEADAKSSSWSCAACGTMEDMLPDGHKLLTCARCKPLQRFIKYCDKDCQKSDWKRHKLTCGKELSAEELLELVGGVNPSAPTPAAPQSRTHTESQSEPAGSDIVYDDRHPAPIPPFTHSRQLKHQIRLQRETPQSDYILTQPYPKPDCGVAVAHPMGKLLFTLCVGRAMKTGDQQSVAQMYQMLAKSGQAQGIGPKSVRTQLSAEYGVSEKVLEAMPLDD